LCESVDVSVKKIAKHIIAGTTKTGDRFELMRDEYGRHPRMIKAISVIRNDCGDVIFFHKRLQPVVFRIDSRQYFN
jgi:hypothetical protein